MSYLIIYINIEMIYHEKKGKLKLIILKVQVFDSKNIKEVVIIKDYECFILKASFSELFSVNTLW